MTLRLTTILALAAMSLAGCNSSGDSGSSSSGSGDFGRSVTGGFVRSSNTYGTNERRMDTYGAVTAPVLPTIGAPGYGK